MQTISATLLAAATSWHGQPLSQVTVRDRRLRWSQFAYYPANTDARFVAQASSGEWMLRVKTDNAGNLWLARIQSTIYPGEAWNTWSCIASGAAAENGDCAIGYWAGTWYTYYADDDNRVYRLTSTDNGLTWSPATRVRSCTRAGFVAAAANWVFIQEHQVHAYVSNPASGALSGPYTQESPTTNGGHGLAAVRDADGADVRYRLLFTVKGDIWAVTFAPNTCTFGAAHRLAPGADQETAGGADNRHPALCCLERGLLLATWVERHDNGLTGEPASWRYPVARLSLDDGAEHYGCEMPLATSEQTDERMAALFDPNEQTVYLGNNRLILSARTYSEDPIWCMRLGPVEMPRYTVRRHLLAPSTLEAHFADAADAWALLGKPWWAEAPLCPLAQVTLSRGYRTAEGQETIDLPPYYIVRVRRSEGQGTGDGVGGWVHLTCTDGLGLLRLWTVPEALLWKSRTIRWLLAELCARVGLRYADDGEAALARTVPLFGLAAGQTALQGVSALLRLGGCVPRIDAVGALHPLPWPRPGTPTLSIGAHGEVRGGDYGLGTVQASGVRITSGGAYAEGEHIEDAWALGLRLTEALHDGRIGLNGDMATTVRDRELALAGLGRRCDEAIIPVRPDLEPGDLVDLYCDATAAPGEDRARVVTGIVEKRDAAHGVYEMRVEMGRA